MFFSLCGGQHPLGTSGLESKWKKYVGKLGVGSLIQQI